LETIVLKAMERNPADRYATAQELADDLRNFVDDRPIRAKRPSLLQRLGRWRRRHKPLVWSVAALVFLVLLLGAAVLGWQQRRQAEVEQAVGEDLREADVLQREERWPETLQVLERASGRLAAGGSPQLRERVKQRRRNVAMVARLEEAGLHRSSASLEALDFAGADQAYAAAFASYGLNLETLDPAEAAERIRTSPIRTQLVAALDDWAFVKKQLRAGPEDAARLVARLADDDPWRQQLRDPEVLKDRAALERLAEAEGVLGQPPGNLALLSRALAKVKGPAAAVRLLRQVQQRYPADFWINFELAFGLREEPATREEAIGFYRAALALRPHSPAVYTDLGNVLGEQKRLAEAEAAHRKAIALKPDFANAYSGLGNGLRDQKKLAEAEAAFRKAIALQPDFANAYSNLGAALGEQKKLAEAEAAVRKAIALQPDFANAYTNLGNVLKGQKKLAEAEAAYRKAIALQPKLAVAYSNLGIVLKGQKKLAEAEAAYRKAIALQPKLAVAYCNLGLALKEQGRFADALVALKRGHELGSRDPSWTAPSALWVREAERLVELDARLPQLLKGETKPANAAECLEIALLCQLYKPRHVAAVRFYQEAFAAQPGLADDLRASHRYNAACAAALAGCGQGKDADHLDAQEGARLRKQALDWLQADLAAWGRLLQKEPDKARPVIVQQMKHWLADADFAGVRGSEALANLPEAERQAWQKLWAVVAETLARAEKKTGPEQKSGMK
jgi:tetratricopeptide (TPR) repeat protein